MTMLNIKEIDQTLVLTIDRLANQNCLNLGVLDELHKALDQAEQNPNCILIILEGQPGFFCTGMDFHEIVSWQQDPDFQQKIHAWTSSYIQLLHRFTTIPKVIAAVVDGKAIGGGVGLAAACDYVIATENSQFRLTEVLWELLPAMVAPYLIRRIGFQKAYEMTLTARSVSAGEAQQLHLVDEISQNKEESLTEFTRRISRLKNSTIQNFKTYFKGLWVIDERMESNAIRETSGLLQQESVKKNIQEFIMYGRTPWQQTKQ